MELVIGIAVIVGLLWFFFFRDKEVVREATSPAPYKVEPEKQPVAEAPATAVVVEAPVVAATPAPVADKPKAKRAAKPKATPKATPAKIAPAKAKATAAKPKAVRKPKMTVAK